MAQPVESYWPRKEKWKNIRLGFRDNIFTEQGSNPPRPRNSLNPEPDKAKRRNREESERKKREEVPWRP